MNTELRWLERACTIQIALATADGSVISGSARVVPGCGVERVLQYRIFGQGIGRGEWTPWADVPVVRETELQKEEGTAP